MYQLVCYDFYLGTSLHESELCSQLIVILLWRLQRSVFCISWVWHSLPHVRYSICLSYVRVLCLCCSSCSGKRRFWPRVSKFTPRSRCTRGFVVRVPALREGRINSWIGGVPGSTPVSCGCISNRGNEAIRISSLWFLTLGTLYLCFLGASGSC